MVIVGIVEIMEIEITCDNCKKGKLKVIQTKKVITEKKGHLGRTYSESKNRDIYITKECPECGAIKGKRVLSHEEKIKRLKEAGIPLIVRSEHVRNE